jgi:hypothetical protein
MRVPRSWRIADLTALSSRGDHSVCPGWRQRRPPVEQGYPVVAGGDLGAEVCHKGLHHAGNLLECDLRCQSTGRSAERGQDQGGKERLMVGYRLQVVEQPSIIPAVFV